jgi:hypothetical protein
MTLVKGVSQSCGCYRKRKSHEIHKKYNRININENVIYIYFFNSNKHTIIDSEDYNKVRNYCWYLDSHGYARSRDFYKGTKRLVALHRVILDVPDYLYVDHVDGNTLNNTKGNIRVYSMAENNRNMCKKEGTKSKYKGVAWRKDRNKWKSLIKYNAKNYYLGLFDKEEDAARAYDKKALELHGEFAKTNKMLGLL